MKDLVEELKKANKEGLTPPQNWTHRAIREIENLRCCGNCLLFIKDSLDPPHCKENYLHRDLIQPWKLCITDHWTNDEATAGKRKGIDGSFKDEI